MKDTKNKSKHLIIGIGNSARADDALGWAFVSHVSQIMGDVFDYELRYQLQVEDSELICDYESILFVDATKEPLQDGFEMKRCEIAEHYYFSSHAQNPETVVYLASTLYDANPEAFVLAISGEEWDLKEAMSEAAQNNLRAAIDHFVSNAWKQIN